MVNKMGSTQPDRSLSSGIPIPQWINKVWDRYEMEPFSPQSQDDVFYIRYPGMGHVEPKENAAATVVTVGQGQDSGVTASKSAIHDFSFHTRPCQEFIPNAPLERKPAVASAEPGKMRVKSQGTDDGFKGEGAACGKSVVEVAHQMIAEGKVVPRPGEDGALSQGFDFGRRRGSKSLPATPLSTPAGSPDSSPRQNRRGIMQHNRYFTGAFLQKTEPDQAKLPGGWLLSGLLGHQLAEPAPSPSPSTVAQEGDAGLRRNKSLTSLAVLRSITEGTSDDEGDCPPPEQRPKVVRPNPSQLREMNFLSPTSM
ncbi:uncharacterized protein LOC134535796 isoform X2 [Bacillus rossius redtenbacheri]|uniref:uncharacterized protein LOC134535796 isoform X2 n=1 Tax=Bacillus rossius redtenbacheri TaxID=93214 RepID=UPI002FDCC6F8